MQRGRKGREQVGNKNYFLCNSVLLAKTPIMKDRLTTENKWMLINRYTLRQVWKIGGRGDEKLQEVV